MSVIEVSGLSEFAATLQQAAERAVPEIHAVTLAFAESIQLDWRARAVMSSGEHGKYYPSSITYEATDGLGLSYEIGPEDGRKQGKMGRGFEYGSVNQPPHLDGAKAVEDNEEAFQTAVAEAASGLLR